MSNSGGGPQLALFRPEDIAVGDRLSFRGIDRDADETTLWEVAAVVRRYRWHRKPGDAADPDGSIQLECRSTGESKTIGAGYVASSARWQLLRF